MAEIYFEKCDKSKRKTCKSDAEVKQWMRDKHLMFVYNRQIFQTDEFGDKKFRYESYIDWIPLNVEASTMNRYSVQIQALHSSDEFLHFHTNESRYWNLVRQASFPYYFNQNMMLNGILIDNDENLTLTSRTVYDLTSLAGEVGGFSRTMAFIFALIYPFVKLGSLETYLIAKLFKQAPSKNISAPHGHLSPQRKLLVMTQASVELRKPINDRVRNPVVEFLKRNGLCCSIFLYDRQDYNYLKSRQSSTSSASSGRSATYAAPSGTSPVALNAGCSDSRLTSPWPTRDRTPEASFCRCLHLRALASCCGWMKPAQPLRPTSSTNS